MCRNTSRSALYGSLFWERVADNETIAQDILIFIFDVILQWCCKTLYCYPKWRLTREWNWSKVSTWKRRGKAYHDWELMRESILLRVCVNPSSGLPSNGKNKIIWNIRAWGYHTHAYRYILDEISINKQSILRLRCF